jgi:hypothetical protein
MTVVAFTKVKLEHGRLGNIAPYGSKSGRVGNVDSL